MPPLPASATATRFASQWVADALAGDEALDFSVLKALVGASSESLAGAPEATRERVALRCLEEVSDVIAAGGDAAATAKVLRADGARTCEDLLLQLIGEVGSSGNLEKDLLVPFSQEIQNIIRIKKPTLPETSFELLKEVDPEIMSMAPPSQLKQNGTTQLDNDQSLCSSHDHVNIEKTKLPTDSGELQQEALVNSVDESGTRSMEKDSVAPTSVLHQPCTSDSKRYDPPQEDSIGAASLGAKSPESSPIVEGNISVGTVPASASCDAALQGSITEPLSKHVTKDHTTMNQPQSHREISPSPPHYIDGERPHDGSTSDLPSKDPRHEELSLNTTVNPDIDRTGDDLPTNASEPEFITEQNTTNISEPHSSGTHLSALQHESGEKVNQDLDDVSASIQPVEKDHVNEELSLQAASVLPSISCNGAIQGGKSKTNHQPGNATEHAMVFEQQSVDKSHLEVSSINKVNQALHDGSIQENNAVNDETNAQTSPMSQACNITLHDKISEAKYLSEENTGKNRTDGQKCGYSASVPSSAQDGYGKSAAKILNKENFGDTSVETSVPSSDHSLHGTAAAGLLVMTDKMPFCTKDQDINDSLGDLSQQDLCVKCGKDGQLLKCSSCLLTAHDSCFGSSATFEETGLFYCPVCFYTKATEAYQKAKKTYCEARKNLSAFLGTTPLVKQHHEQPTVVLPGATNREGHSNGCDLSKRKNIHQNEADNLAHRDEEPHRQRKKQKINATGNGYPEQIVTEKVPLQNSDVAPMNKHTILKNNSCKRVQGTEKQQQVENKEARKEAGNDNSSHEMRTSSQKKIGPENQEVESDKEDDPANSHQPDDSDELEATSSNGTGNRSSPPWRNMRHNKARLHEKEAVASSNSRKTAQREQHMPSLSRPKNYAYPQKRYSNPVAPSGRRTKLCWTEEEEAVLKEAMAKFTPQDDTPIPWVQILEYGRDVFHRTRLPSDLRVKWRNMKKRAGC
ncbi:hypothetical protein SEVIR_2G064800v4 [Setaria viridis]|uniref:Myb-like domain-containing protein n=2 Tax=Setaria viridis TaxID=4556 RepID=A0A4U6VSN2_SETVI|nr:uncharacterized protein LOC117846537 [Setaria viridis]TKW30849.1 hypothetical protein SEVIR_2G064800v2 [Setaria viridis]